MTRDYISMDRCPFREGDRVKDQHDKAGREGVVTRVEEEHVWFAFDDGQVGYRTWSHEFDTLFGKFGGGLLRLTKRQP